MKKIKVGYFGDGKWAHSSFKKLINDKSIDISFLCLRNKNPDLFLSKLAKKKNIKVFNPKNINAPSFVNKKILKGVNLFVSMSYNQIFKKKIICMSDLGVINCHAGNLPFYRGRNPLNWGLINGEKKFGITVHYIDDENIDHGDIIMKNIYYIKKKDTYGSLLKKAYLECPKILIKSIKKIQSGNIDVIKQDQIDKKGSYFKKRKSGDERINWNSNAVNIFNFVRALFPAPLAQSHLNKNRIYIKKVDHVFKKIKKSVKPGTITKVAPKYFYISSKDRLIKILDWTSNCNLYEKQRLK
jgi:methionyl-tRNA formyltransferase